MIHQVAVFAASGTAASGGANQGGVTQWLPQLVISLVGSLLAFSGVWIQSRNRKDAFDALDRSIEIRKKLRDGSQASNDLDHYIERQIRELAKTTDKRRDPSGFALAIGFLIVAGAVTWWGETYGGWWRLLWVLAATMFLLGMTGLIQDGRRLERDARGRPIKAPKPDASNPDPK